MLALFHVKFELKHKDHCTCILDFFDYCLKEDFKCADNLT